MMKFMLVTRRPDGGTLERFLYEWSILHVALMLTTPTVTRVFKRYVQHYGLWDVPEEDLLYPRAHEGWETMADHWVETYADLVESVTAPDYVERMQPHRFSSSSFIIMLADSATLFERPDFKSGGTKLVQLHKKAAGLSQADFDARFRDSRGPAMVAALKSHGLRKYVQNTPADLDPATFRGTLFERGSIGLYAGMEEIWLDGSADLKAIHADKPAMAAIRDSEKGLFEPGGSFSMIMLERVAFDFCTAEKHRPAAIHDPGSLEAALRAQEAIYKEALARQDPP